MKNKKITHSEKYKKNLPRRLLIIAIFMAVTMTIYETLKQVIHPEITIWQSHVITIIFSTFAATVAGYFVLRKLIELTNSLERKKTESEYLRKELEGNIERLKLLLSEVKTLTGLLPICASCKRIRDDQGYWNQIEAYIQLHTDVDFTHGLCPECARKLYPDYIEEIGI